MKATESLVTKCYLWVNIQLYTSANTMNFNIRHMKQNYSALLNELQV